MCERQAAAHILAIIIIIAKGMHLKQGVKSCGEEYHIMMKWCFQFGFVYNYIQKEVC